MVVTFTQKGCGVSEAVRHLGVSASRPSGAKMLLARHKTKVRWIGLQERVRAVDSAKRANNVWLIRKTTRPVAHIIVLGG